MIRGKKEGHRREWEERQAIRCLCAILYLFCILNMTGISLNFRAEEKMHYNNAQKVKEAVSEKVAGETKEYGDIPPKIALTFDDGPNEACTGRLLKGLKKRNVRATFFVIGKNVKANPKLTKRIYEDGHMIGNHTYSHIDRSKVSEEKAEKELKNDTWIAAYQNGYALYCACGHSTVFPVHTCGAYLYMSSGVSSYLPEQFFEKEPWYVRLVLEGEDRLEHNQRAKEQERTASYSAISEEWQVMSSRRGCKFIP